MTIRLSSLILFFILTCSLRLSLQKNLKEKALLSMKMAKGVCNWNNNSNDKWNQKGFNASIQGWLSCQGVKWSDCDKTCSKFQFQDCPTPPKRRSWKGKQSQSRIAGGEDAKPGELPFVVYIEIQNNFRCSGVLVSPHYVLTAAQCVDVAKTPSDVKLIFGSVSISELGSGSQTRQASRLIIYPNWSSTVEINDIALIEINHPLALTQMVQTSIIATPDLYPSGFVLASGWGRTPNDNPDKLKKVAMIVIPKDTCQFYNNGSFRTDICVDTVNQKSICHGDFGGPLVQEFSANCAWLVGLARSTIDCGSRELPAKFTGPQFYTNWIKSQVIARIPQVSPPPGPFSFKTIEAEENEFPFQVRILLNGLTICGGAILNTFYVLTAASCLSTPGLSISNLLVIAGEISIRTIEKTEQTRTVHLIIPHRNFDPVTHLNDIGLIKVKEAFTMNSAVNVAELPPANHALTHSFFTTGWGFIADPSVFDRLQKIKTRREPFNECFKRYGCLITEGEREVICGNTDNGGNPCRTDFGGPLVEKWKEGEYFIIGVVSYRIGCNENHPTVYTNVRFYSKWLESHMTTPSSIDSKPNSYPFLAVIMLDGFPICPGSLINPTHVLTAASCFKNLPLAPISDHVTVVVGKHNLAHQEPTESTVPVDKLIIHESYDQATNFHDIALVHLKEAAQLSNHVLPLVLRDSFPVFQEGDTATSIGWGFAHNQSLTPLQEISLDLLNDFECKTAYGSTSQNIIQEMLCTQPLGIRYCVGYLGGPLILPAASSVPCFGLLGIKSVAPECKPVTENIISMPSIYTEVAHYIPWIRRNLLTTNLRVDSDMVGGEKAAENEFPYLVKVTYNGVTICAGAILTEFIVITTALCVNEKRFGLLSVTAGTGKEIQTRLVGPYFPHELFDAVTMENDICIMQLVDPFVFNKMVSKIPYFKTLKSNAITRDSQLRQLAGDLIVGGWAMNISHSMVMAIIQIDTCRKSYGCSVESLVGKIICASRFRENSDTSITPCRLMHGSPFVATLVNGTKLLIGLASFGTNCSTIAHPSIFTQLEHYDPWIEENDLMKGNNNAPPHSFPFQAAIIFEGNFVCGGAVIHRNYVLTSASCFLRVEPPSFTILVGKHVLGSKEEFEQSRTVEEIHVHEGYSDRVDKSPNDIALLYFSNPLIVSKAVQVAFITQSQTRESGLAHVTGWTSALLKNRMLQSGIVPIIPDSDCVSAYNKERVITDTMLCTSSIGSIVCMSDPGGPLTKTFDFECHLLVGIATPNCGKKGFPTVYTDVSSFYEWIQKNIDIGRERNRRRNFINKSPGAKNADKNEFSFIVHIVDRNRQTVCVGSLLNSFMVVTSAFCAVEQTPADLIAIAGDHDMKVKEPTEQEWHVIAIIIHPEFNILTQANDIAVLILSDNFILGASVNAIELSSSMGNLFAFELTLVGWGHLISKPSDESILQKVRVDAMEGLCDASYGCSMPNHPDSVLCIQIPGNSTSVIGGGLQGAPVVHKFQDGSFKLYGIASYRHPCNQHVCPAVFARFPYYSGFLQNIVAGGTVVPPNALPFHALILLKGRPSCSGALVSEWYVITTAHCLMFPQRASETDIVVILGTRSQESPYDREAVTRQIRRYNTHPDYWLPDRGYNIAILELAQSVQFTSSIKPAFIPPANYQMPRTVTVSGYGLDPRLNTLLRQASFITLPLKQCLPLQKDASRSNYDKSVCTEVDASAMCACDSGSPMTDIFDIVGIKCHRLIGVASFCNYCVAQKVPSVYTHVPEYWDWINLVVAQSHPLNNNCRS